MKLWAGRFQKETDSAVNDFNSSIAFDARMYRQDITGSIAHATMLGNQGIIEPHEAEKIIEGLKTILAAIEQVKNGISIMIFPEGTRSKDADELQMLPFHEGSFKIATKSGCPIIPVAISNSSALFEDQFPRIKPAAVTIEYGAPIYPKELSKEEQKFLGRHVQGQILEMLKKNQAAVQRQ